MLGSAVERRRRAPYPGTGAPVVVPAEIWTRSVEELRSYAASRSEALVFWGGVVVSASVQVTGLYLLRHEAQGGRVRVTPEESRWLLRRLRQRDEKLIAQVHSHPGQAFHSHGDDERAASFHAGYLSIVAPDFAVPVREIGECEVFESTGDCFRRLGAAEVRARLQIISLVEERLPSGREPSRSIPTIRKREWRWLTTIASSLSEKLSGRKKL